MADSMEMTFGLVDRVGQKNNVLDGVQIPLTGRGKFWGNGVAQCNVYT